jgi:hypothetical protein
MEGRVTLRDLLHKQINPLFEDYLKRLDAEIVKNPNDEKMIDRNSRLGKNIDYRNFSVLILKFYLACDLHSHKMLIYRNYHVEDMNADVAKTLVGSFVYLTTRSHQIHAD